MVWLLVVLIIIARSLRGGLCATVCMPLIPLFLFRVEGGPVADAHHEQSQSQVLQPPQNSSSRYFRLDSHASTEHPKSGIPIPKSPCDVCAEFPAPTYPNTSTTPDATPPKNTMRERRLGERLAGKSLAANMRNEAQGDEAFLIPPH